MNLHLMRMMMWRGFVCVHFHLFVFRCCPRVVAVGCTCLNAESEYNIPLNLQADQHHLKSSQDGMTADARDHRVL
jgi:hypothetical protein